MQVLLSRTTEFVYHHGLKPLFFRLDPEFVHDHHVEMGQVLGRVPLLKRSVAWLWAYHDWKLVKTLDGIVFPNPVGLSAGFDYNGDLTGVLSAVGFGFHTIGTITLHPYAGNTPPRLGRFPRSQALLVNKGLKNIGVKAIVKKLKGVAFDIPTGFSVASTNTLFNSEVEQIADMVKCFQLLEKSSLKHAYYELNISCPNTFGGEPFTTPVRLKRLMKRMDALKLRRPLYIKMPIDQTPKETLALLQVLDKHRVQGVIFGNLTKDKTNPDVDPEDRKIWQTKKGNLSGKPTWRRSNALIRLTRRHFPTRFTIIGTGGIFSGADAQEKLSAGADLLQLITGMIFQGPQLIGQITYHLSGTDQHRQ